MSKSHTEEFIGRKIKVVQARNKSLELMEGKIIDETKNTFRIINGKNTQKTLLKKGTFFLIGSKIIRGNNILCRPEERIKLKK